MRHGDLVTVAARGDYTTKPRPALVVQADVFAELHSVAVCLLSTQRVDAPLLRIDVHPGVDNGLSDSCQIMIDKLVTVPRTRVGHPLGRLDRETLLRVDRSLAVFLGIA